MAIRESTKIAAALQRERNALNKLDAERRQHIHELQTVRRELEGVSVSLKIRLGTLNSTNLELVTEIAKLRALIAAMLPFVNDGFRP